MKVLRTLITVLAILMFACAPSLMMSGCNDQPDNEWEEAAEETSDAMGETAEEAADEVEDAADELEDEM